MLAANVGREEKGGVRGVILCGACKWLAGTGDEALLVLMDRVDWKVESVIRSVWPPVAVPLA